MPSVLGLLEAREKKVLEEVARLREEAERVQAALGDAERALQRLADARCNGGRGAGRAVFRGCGAGGKRGGGGGGAGRVEGMTASVLAPDCQRIVSVLASDAGREGMRCQHLAMALDLEAVPAKFEGLRSQAKRLVERGWAQQVLPGVFTAFAGPAD
ncbi:hypothetical protein [Streptomyces niphimycinicus]|uniref:hypothetical protein n=1 Tax=Streptomyces niphimycinicus TaxID=2842201 RepID=UPI00209B4E20|nr:hypothetical protein [Streptomyces niphimycinicus]